MHVSLRFISRITLYCLTCFTFCISSLQPAHAAWTITPTATGSYTIHGYEGTNSYTGENVLSNPDDLNNSGGYLYITSNQYFPDGLERGQSIDENLTVKFHLEWDPTYGDENKGLNNENQIKVLIRVTGCVAASAKAYEYWNSGGEHIVGWSNSSAWVTSSLGNAGPVNAHAAEGNLNPESAPAPFDISEVRTLTVSNNVAETTVDLTRHSEVSTTFGEATASSGVSAIMSVAIVKMSIPEPTSDPASNEPRVCGNQYDFDVPNVTAIDGTVYPFARICFPIKTDVVQYIRTNGAETIDGDPNDIARNIDWTINRSWQNPVPRMDNIFDTNTRQIQPCCQLGSTQDGTWPGITFGRLYYLPPTNSDYGAATIAMNVDPSINIIGENTANTEVFWPATDKHHPDPDYMSTENWFYYYNQIFPTSAFYTTDTSYYHFQTGNIYLGWTAHGNMGFPVFKYTDGKIQRADDLYIYGVHTFIKNWFHENGHKQLHEAGDYLAPLDPARLYSDGDEDGLTDLFELQVGLDPAEPNTTKAYPPGGSTPGDAQCTADIIAYGNLKTVVQDNPGLMTQDWADDGLQKGPITPVLPWHFSSNGKNVPEPGVQLLTYLPNYP